MKKNLIRFTFWPAFLFLVLILVYSILDQDGFYLVATQINDWVLKYFGWMFSVTSFVSLILIIVVYFSPLGDVTLGGRNAKPILSKKNWAIITLCTAMAAGALFWGIAEPIYHMSQPPKGIEANSWESAKFAMETMLIHWSVHPYSLYTLPVIVFAFSFFNMKNPFSVSSQLSPIFSKIGLDKNKQNSISKLVDSVLIFAMSLGILGVISTGIINMGGILREIVGVDAKEASWALLLLLITLSFIVSSISGITKGIKIMSNINVVLYYALLGILFVVGPTMFMIEGTIEALGGALSNLPERLLTTGAYAEDMWAKNWTVFYAGSWSSWAPVSALFLARLGVGYKIKDVIKVNFGIPIVFNIIWSGVFSNLAINHQLKGKSNLIQVLEREGVEQVILEVLGSLPGAKIIIIIFFFALVFSMITAMDSTTNSVAALSTKGISIDNQEAPAFLKILWGILYAVLSYIILTVSGIEGIKIVSNLGGLPNIIILLGGSISLIIILSKWSEYKKFAD